MFRALTILAVVLAVIIAVAARRMIAPAGAAAGTPDRSRFPRLEALAAFVFWLSLIALGATAFLGATLRGCGLTGYLILIHVGCGATVAAGLVGLLVLRAEQYRFGSVSARFTEVQKACFWIVAASVLVLMSSILFSMLRITGTDGQRLVVEVHRYAALAALVASIVYFGSGRGR